MSFTAAYSELLAIRDGEITRDNPRILDVDGFETVHESVSVSESTWQDIQVTGEDDDYSDYPKKTWKVLKGFKTWKPDSAVRRYDSLEELARDHEDYRTGPLGYGYNIERVGIPYGGLDGAWKPFFAEVSKYTEPFAVYHSPREHTFPDVTDFKDGKEKVYLIKCAEGSVYVEERTFKLEDTEVLVDEIGDTLDAEPGGARE